MHDIFFWTIPNMIFAQVHAKADTQPLGKRLVASAKPNGGRNQAWMKTGFSVIIHIYIIYKIIHYIYNYLYNINNAIYIYICIYIYNTTSIHLSIDLSVYQLLN